MTDHGDPSEFEFWVLAEYDPERLIGMIKARMSDSDMRLAAEALGMASVREAINVLLDLSEHPSAVVREAAVYGLADHIIEEPFCADVLGMLALNDPSLAVRTAAIKALVGRND